MSIEKNVQIVKNFLAALGRRDKQGLLALAAENIEWIVPGEDWPLAGTHRGYAELAADFGGALDGKVVIDIANPVARDLSGLVTPHGSSSAQETAKALPAG